MELQFCQTFISQNAGAAPTWKHPAPAALELCWVGVWKPVWPVCPAQRLPFPTGCAALLHSEFNSLWPRFAPWAPRTAQIPAGMGNDSHKSVSSPHADTELCKVSFQPPILTEGCISISKVQLREALLLLTWCSHPGCSYTWIAAAGSAQTPGTAPQHYKFILWG